MTLIEDVGNLVRPARFDLGEDATVAVLPVIEGEGRPTEYSYMFRAPEFVALRWIERLPDHDGKTPVGHDNLRPGEPITRVIEMPVRTNDGLEAWCRGLRATLAASTNGEAVPC